MPYIAVLDEQNQFYGILTHSSLLNMLSQSWNVNQGSYVLTVASPGKRGEFATIGKIISKYASIASCITLDLENEQFVRRTLFTLPKDVDKETCDKIVEALESKHFRVVDVEDLSESR